MARLDKALQGKLALVTGAQGGIGAAICDDLLARGAYVVGWDSEDFTRDEPQFEAQRIDLTDRPALDRAASALLSRFGPLDILVNNAGIQGPTTPIAQQTDAVWDAVIAVNLTAVFRLCRLLLPGMRRVDGRIINIASVAGLRGVDHAIAYSASKGGVIALTQALAKELARTGITVNCVAPAVTQTRIMEQMDAGYREQVSRKIPMGRPGLPAEVASMVGWIAGPESSFSTGAVFDVSGGRLAY